MRLALLLLGLLAVSAAAKTQDEAPKRVHVALSADSVSKAINEVLDAVREEGAKAKAAAESFAEKHPNGILARVLGKDTEETGTKRRLLTLSTMAERVSERMQTVQDFLQGMMGMSWRNLVPERWANSSFDWSHLGEFDYGSNLGDFLDAHDLANLTDIRSVHDLASSMQEVEAAFCDQESFTPSKKVPAKCTGPSVTIALVPKVCILEAKTKQILCDPAKLVLTKTPGSCTHKYMSASSWTGKECKITGGAGFSDELVIGGGERSVPLIELSVGYE